MRRKGLEAFWGSSSCESWSRCEAGPCTTQLTHHQPGRPVCTVRKSLAALSQILLLVRQASITLEIVGWEALCWTLVEQCWPMHEAIVATMRTISACFAVFSLLCIVWNTMCTRWVLLGVERERNQVCKEILLLGLGYWWYRHTG